MEIQNSDEIVKNYVSKRPLYEEFCSTLNRIINDLTEGIDIAKIESRAKDIDSFREKIEREDKSYTDPLNEITDLAGCRIITYLTSDIEKICNIITSEFIIDDKNSINKSEALDPDRFGYMSVHYVISLNEDRIKLREYSRFKNMKAEIQIRTILQHAWAAIDHKLRYKTVDNIPKNLRRGLFRVSALLESADKEFDESAHKIESIKEDYKKSIESTPELVPLDLDSVTTFANESSIAIKLLELAKVKNITITELTPVAKLPEYTTFIKMANSAGMSTIDDIKKSLSTHESKYPDKVDSFIKTWRLKINNKSQRLVTTRDSFLRWMLFLSLDNELANKSQTWVSKNPTILESLDETRKNDSA